MKISDLPRALSGGSLSARVARSSLWTAIGHIATMIVRLGSNLVLTRLLFPESMGLMALVTVVLVGLAMFSDLGLGISVVRSPRGGDKAFLDTAWTLQIARGLILWFGTLVLALPFATFYGEAELKYLIPVAGLTLVTAGLIPTRIELANRDLLVGRVVLLDLWSQVIGVFVTIALAYWLRSVWALVFGSLVSAVLRLALMSAFLPGPRNSILIEREAASELLHFGKWLFFATAYGFLISQGDKFVLGKYLSIDMLGVYNIAFFLASAPLALGSAVMGRVLVPVYRQKPPSESRENFLAIRKLRMIITGGLLAGTLSLAFLGRLIVDILYDPRYEAAGAIVIGIACMQIPLVICMAYDQVAIAAGDSKRYFWVLAIRAALFLSLFIAGVEFAGLIGALIGQMLAIFLAYPMVVWLARLHGSWDPFHDLVFWVAGAIFGVAAVWLHFDALVGLAKIGMGG